MKAINLLKGFGLACIFEKLTANKALRISWPFKL